MEVPGLLISSLILQVWMQLVAGKAYSQECAAWDEVVSTLNNGGDEQMVMMCTRNQQCTGVECTGIYQYQEVLHSGKKQVDYCFGVALHPCRKPIDWHFYVETSQNNQTYQKNVSSSGKPYDTGIGFDVTGGHANLYVQVDVNNTRIKDKKYMGIEMHSKVRVTTLGFFEQWPESHKKVLIPPIFVPVPECNPQVVTPNYMPGTCRAPKSTIAPPHQSNASHTGKKCKQLLGDGTYDANACGHGETCGDEGFCVCLINYIRVNDTCQLGHTDVTPFVVTDSPIAGHKKKFTSIMIVVVVAVVAFLLMVAVGFFIVKYRKYKARYGSHQLLNEDDENAPDDPLDGEVDDDPPLDLST